MINQGEIISHAQMSLEEGLMLQRGMNYRVRGKTSIILMSVRKGAPYADRVEEDGKVLIYEGHDVPKTKELKSDPKIIDQPMKNPNGKLTQNGLFYEAARQYKEGKREAEIVKVYEKVKNGIWVFNGFFKLVDSWIEKNDKRNVFKFRLELIDGYQGTEERTIQDLTHNRIIPSSVKLEVWKRDGGKCVKCGSKDNLHYDHILPFSKGGTSLKADNIQLLCARHNLQKRDRIE